MAEAMDLDGQIRQNLKDAACPDELIEIIMISFTSDRRKDGLRLLKEHREHLLNIVHEHYKRIDCLDYLLFKFKA